MSTSSHSKILAVDLDGSLANTDLLHESLIKAFYATPWIIFLLPFWLLKGKTKLKQELAVRSELNVDSLPYNQDLIEYLEQEKHKGREIILCTGSWHTLAEQVCEKFSFFSGFYGSDENGNLTGSNKAKLLLETYGEKNFSYVGNEKKDLKIWEHADSAVVISKSDSLSKLAEKACPVEKTILREKTSLKIVNKQIRIHQWVKNLLVFVPLVTSHQTTDMSLLFSVLLGFFAYSFCASATYILNDLSDLESDRKHHKKCFRPLACGALSITQGLVISAILLIASIIISLFLPPWFLLTLVLYIVITLSYSFKLKRLQTIDITILASLYTLRIISGAAAINILPSFWLLAFSMFVFLCLAIIKRLSEIYKSKDKQEGDFKLSGRGYYISDFPILMSLASTSGILSVLVFAMYINSPEVAALYAEPYALWLICPLFGYWIIRIVIMASRGQIDEDPIVFAIKDRRSWVTGFIILLIIFASSI